jgi:hypothetical protein
MSEAPPTIETRAGFVDALRWGLRQSIALDARLIHCVDPTFADWPLDDEETVRGLAAWLRRPGRRLSLLAASFDEVPRVLQRFTAWRRDWVHAIDAWQAPAELVDSVPTVMCSDGGVSVELIDPARWRGRAAVDPAHARLWFDQVDAILQRSERAFAATTLGL